MSGLDRTRGEQARQGIELLVNQNVAQGVKVSGRPIAVLHVDSRNSAETVRAQAVRLVTVNRVEGLIGSLDAELAEPLAREGQAHGIRVVLTGELTRPGRSDWVVCLGVDAGWRGRVLARLVEDRGWDRLAVVSDGGSALAGNLSASFLREVRKNAKTTVNDWTFVGDKEPGQWPAEVARWQPKALLLACSPQAFLKGGETLRQAGFKGPLLYGGEDFGTEPFQRGSEGEVYLATVCCREGLTKRGSEFAEEYQKAYQEKPGYSALQAADALRLLLETLQKAGQAGGQRSRDQVPAVEPFESLTGTVTFKDRQTRAQGFPSGTERPDQHADPDHRPTAGVAGGAREFSFLGIPAELCRLCGGLLSLLCFLGTAIAITGRRFAERRRIALHS